MLLANPRPVTSIRYYAPSGVPVVGSTFVATVDLAGVVPKDGQATVSINVEPVDPRIRVLGYDPAVASIQLEPLTSKSVPVKVEHGVVPDGLTLGDTVVDPHERHGVRARNRSSPRSSRPGPTSSSSRPASTSTRTSSSCRSTSSANAVRPVEVTRRRPASTIPVFSDRQSRTLPVNPVITGTPAAGFEIDVGDGRPAGRARRGRRRPARRPDPGRHGPDPDDRRVRRTRPCRSGSPCRPGSCAVGSEPISVTITIRPVTATRTFNAGLRLLGASGDLTYALSIDRVLVTIGGSTADLDRLSAPRRWWWTST